MGSLVISIFLYACETWTLTADLQRRIQAMFDGMCHICKSHMLHLYCLESYTIVVSNNIILELILESDKDSVAQNSKPVYGEHQQNTWKEQFEVIPW